jgi:hypothetical protein
MRFIPLLKSTFSSGELNPETLAREDTEAFSKGAKTLTNWSIIGSGGIIRRPGSLWQLTLPGRCKLFSYEFNDDETYVMAFSDARCDIYQVSEKTSGELDSVTLVQSLTSQPWTEGIIRNLRISASLDTIFITEVAGSFAMRKITRTSETSFSIALYVFEQDSGSTHKYQPYFRFGDPSITLTPSGTSGTITLTASSAFFDTDNLHDGVIFRLIDDISTDSPKEVLVSSVTNSTVAVGTVRDALDGTTATTEWDEAVFSAKRGYQATVKMHEGRLGIGGSRDLPHIVWLSNVQAFFKFDDDAGDNNMIDRPIVSGEVEQVRHLMSEDDLEIFGRVQEHIIPSTESNPLTPSSSPIRKQTSTGSAIEVMPVNYDGATLFMDKQRQNLREFLFNTSSEKYTADPISLLASHLIKEPIDMFVMPQSRRRPEGYCYIVNETDGTLTQFHSVRIESQAGFGRWSTEGWFDAGCVVNDRIFMSVKRKLSGNPFDSSLDPMFGRGDTGSEIEYHLETFDEDITLDMAVKFTPPAPTKIFTNAHLAGRTVRVVERNKIYHGEYVADSNGTVTLLEDARSEVVIGLNYTSTFTSLRPSTSARGFPITGEIKRLAKLVMLLNDTMTLDVVSDDLLVRQVDDDLSLDPDAISEEREFSLSGYSIDGTFTLILEDPLPATILGYQLTIGV